MSSIFLLLCSCACLKGIRNKVYLFFQLLLPGGMARWYASGFNFDVHLVIIHFWMSLMLCKKWKRTQLFTLSRFLANWQRMVFSEIKILKSKRHIQTLKWDLCLCPREQKSSFEHMICRRSLDQSKPEKQQINYIYIYIYIYIGFFLNIFCIVLGKINRHKRVVRWNKSVLQ